jgi:hypothetical protein
MDIMRQHTSVRVFRCFDHVMVSLLMFGSVAGCGDQSTPISSTAQISATVLISGSPPSVIAAGRTYTFEPVAADTSGATLRFSVTNKPKWASFNVATGQLAGTPGAADVGEYQNIVVAAASGVDKAQLPAFSISVQQPSGVQQPSASSVTLSWIPPTENADGTALKDLAGYHIYYSTSATTLSNTIDLTDALANSYLISGLSSGTWYFAVAAYDSAGVESAPSSTAIATI